MRKLLRVGLTGGLGAGKSLVLKFFQEKGIPVLQTDHLGHQILNEKKFLKVLKQQFGLGILNRRGMVDRHKLAGIVFNQPRKRENLNKLLHPEVRRRVAAWIEKQTSRELRYPIVVVEVPLLFERGYNKAFDFVLSVSAPRIERRNRLLKRGWNLSEIHRREKAQWPQSRKNSASDGTLFNQKDRKNLKYAVNRWIQRFEEDYR